MPLVDMPLDKLKEYQGINPKPADFDAFWDAALKELDGVDPQARFVKNGPKLPHAECYDLYFKSVRGAEIHAKYVKPSNISNPVPAVLQFHGYTGGSGDWSEKLTFVSQGFAVAAMDCRGQGGLSEDTGGVKGTTYQGHIIRGLDDSPEQLLFRHIFLDTVQLARVIMSLPEIDEARVVSSGGSQGGALSLACAALEPRIVKTVSVFPFLCDYRRVWEMDLAKGAYQELQTFFRHFDPRHEREDEIFYRLGYIDVQHLAPRIQAEVLMGSGLMDTICPPSTQFAAYNKIKTAKQVKIYPDFGHEGLPGFNDIAMEFLLDI
ncbi:acetylxylan esterase [Paenibacillus lemnae]|uniref:Acetylxylan esterase n=1 Tax=Paenibacillus lemnae TaxID=1330551 RepID=A0A848M5X5_PAELE|nr:acetylxylan esterase [Paenibacillus lemnae]NMO96548.1 acetylxylan esterase [Paenibacillus lemnae]